MKPSEIAKACDQESAKIVAEKTGIPYSTLLSWAKTRPLAYKILCIGLYELKGYNLMGDGVVEYYRFKVADGPLAGVIKSILIEQEQINE